MAGTGFGLSLNWAISQYAIGNNQAVDAADEYVSFIFRAPAVGGAISKCAIRLGALTGSSPTYVVALEGVSGVVPDGTIKGGGSPASVEIAPTTGAGTVQEYTFANTYTPGAGELLALTIRPKTGTSIDGSNNWSFTRGQQSASNMPYGYYNSGSGAAVAGAAFSIYQGTSWYYEVIQAASYVTTGSSPVWSGNKFTLPDIGATVRCPGCWYAHQLAGNAGYRVALYDASDNQLCVMDNIARYGNSNSVPLWLEWTAGPITLTCGATYRLVVSTANPGVETVRSAYLDYGSAAQKNSPLASIASWTQGTTGSWTETDTRLAMCSPFIDTITPPAGGGFTGSHQYIGLGR